MYTPFLNIIGPLVNQATGRNGQKMASCYTRTCTHTHTHTQTHTNKHTHKHTQTHTHIQTHIHLSQKHTHTICIYELLAVVFHIIK